jgi:HK97 family phage major capsid protein
MELHEQRAHTIKVVEDMIEKAEKEDRDLTPEELAEVDEQKKKTGNLDEQIKASEATAEVRKWKDDRLADLKATRGRKAAFDDVGKPNPNSELAEFDTRFSQYSKLRTFTAENFGPNHKQIAYRAGQWCRAAIWQDPMAQRWCNQNGVEFRALAANVNTAGGVLVPSEMEQAIVINREQHGIVRQNVTVVPMGRDVMEVPRLSGNITSYFVGENTSGTESDSTFDNVTLTARKLMAITRYSTELADDAIMNIGDFLAGEFGWSFANKEDDCAFNGDGTNAYGHMQGIRNKLVATASLTGAPDASTANADTYAELAAADLETLLAVCPAYALPGAKWYCSAPAFALVFTAITQAGGGNTFSTIAGGPEMRYLGYPIVVTQVMPTSTGSLDNVVMILFGDLKKACILGDRRGITVMVSPHRYFESDQWAIKATERFDFVCHSVGDTSTAGPVVGLVGAA